MLNSATTMKYLLSHTLMILVCLSATCKADQSAENSSATKKADDALATTKNDERIGKKVIVTVAGAALRTPQAVVWKAYLGETFTVSLTNGEWLWIEEKRGWLWEKETIRFDDAVTEMSKRITEKPTAENYHLRGIAYTSHQQHDKAVADFDKSLQLQPNDAGVFNNRGKAHYALGSYDSAIKDFSQAINADGEHFVAMNNRALCHIAKEEYKKALKDLNSAMKLNKNYPEALNNRGVVHAGLRQYKAAVKDYTAALKIDDSYMPAYGNRAFAYRKQGLLKEAVADLMLAREKRPQDHEPVNDLAWIYATTEVDGFRNPEKAVQLATKACEISQYKDWNSLDTLAAAYAAKGDFKNARTWIAAALENAPDEERSRLNAHQKQIESKKAITE